jgi:hypothetical protein
MLFALIFLGQGNNVENINVEKGQILMSKGQIYGKKKNIRRCSRFFFFEKLH